MIQSAVERQIEMIGEVMNDILKINAELAITDTKKFANTQNRTTNFNSSYLL